MNQTLQFFIFMVIFLSPLSFADDRSPESKDYNEDCHRYIGSCEYYLCREKNRPCGGDGYFINFGYKYCTKIVKKLIPKVSAQGKQWLLSTASCLQKQLDSVDDMNSCKEIKKLAIDGHNRCYEETGFCSLNISDKMRLIKTVAPSLKTKGVIKEGVQLFSHCTNPN